MTRTKKFWHAKQVAGSEERKEIRKTCLEWGLCPDDDASHRAFEATVVQAVEQAQRLRNKNLPFVQETRDIASSFSDAAREVLQDNVEVTRSTGYAMIDDSLKGGECDAPFSVQQDKYHPRDQFVVFLKASLTRQARSAFDPLRRFTEEEITVEEFYEDWVEDPTGGEVSGLVFEGIVVSFAMHSGIPCRCCAHRTLRWSGGSCSFSDMECITCQSVYEIKSKKNLEAINKRNKYGFSCGSYSGWWSLHGQKRRVGWKHYLVVVSRSASLPRGKTTFAWPVQVAEIDKVLPRLCCYSFLPNTKNGSMQLQTVVRTKSNTEPWFQIPHESLDNEALVRSVLSEFVPELFQPCREDADGNQVSEVAELRDLLAGLEVADDWEDLTDDENEVEHVLQHSTGEELIVPWPKMCDLCLPASDRCSDQEVFVVSQSGQRPMTDARHLGLATPAQYL